MPDIDVKKVASAIESMVEHGKTADAEAIVATWGPETKQSVKVQVCRDSAAIPEPDKLPIVHLFDSRTPIGDQHEKPDHSMSIVKDGQVVEYDSPVNRGIKAGNNMDFTYDQKGLLQFTRNPGAVNEDLWTRIQGGTFQDLHGEIISNVSVQTDMLARNNKLSLQSFTYTDSHGTRVSENSDGTAKYIFSNGRAGNRNKYGAIYRDDYRGSGLDAGLGYTSWISAQEVPAKSETKPAPAAEKLPGEAHDKRDGSTTYVTEGRVVGFDPPELNGKKYTPSMDFDYDGSGNLSSMVWNPRTSEKVVWKSLPDHPQTFKNQYGDTLTEVRMTTGNDSIHGQTALDNLSYIDSHGTRVTVNSDGSATYILKDGTRGDRNKHGAVYRYPKNAQEERGLGY